MDCEEEKQFYLSQLRKMNNKRLQEDAQPERDYADVTRQTTNTIVSFLENDSDLIETLQHCRESETGYYIDLAMDMHLGKTENALAANLISIAKLYINWDIVIARLKGQEWHW